MGSVVKLQASPLGFRFGLMSTKLPEATNLQPQPSVALRTCTFSTVILLQGQLGSQRNPLGSAAVFESEFTEDDVADVSATRLVARFDVDRSARNASRQEVVVFLHHVAR